jgi:hypothetical protein
MHSKFVWKSKFDSDGRLERRKCRLVACGYSQREGIDYGEVYAPVTSRDSLRAVISVAAGSDLLLFQMDAVTAFLNAPLDEDLFVRPPIGMDVPEHTVLKLQRALYGCKQAPKQWSDMLSSWMISHGFQRSGTDPCIYVREGDEGCFLIVAVYVDDFLCAALSEATVRDFYEEINGSFKMKFLGPAHSLLGMRLVQDISAGTIRLDQESYASDLLAKARMADSKPVSTPLTPHTVLGVSRGTDQPSQLPLGPERATAYRAIVGALLYLVSCTRPDLAVATSQLSRFMSAPCEEHYQALKRTLRFLRGSVSRGLIYRRVSGSPVNQLCAFADASWGDQANSRSTAGHLVFLNGGPVAWRSKVQSVVALSTCEAEYMAITEASKAVLFLRSLVEELGFPQATIPVFGDNQPSIHLALNPSVTPRSKHIAIRYHFVRDLVSAAVIGLRYIPTTDQIADAMTKNLPAPAFAQLTSLMFGAYSGFSL